MLNGEPGKASRVRPHQNHTNCQRLCRSSRRCRPDLASSPGAMFLCATACCPRRRFFRFWCACQLSVLSETLRSTIGEVCGRFSKGRYWMYAIAGAHEHQRLIRYSGQLGDFGLFRAAAHYTCQKYVHTSNVRSRFQSAI